MSGNHYQFNRHFVHFHENQPVRVSNFVKNRNSLPPLSAKTPLGQPFIELTTVESTNIYAMEQIQANMAVHGTSYFAHDQTAGKGQWGKSWIAEPGSHIALSVIVAGSELNLSNPFSLSMLSALAVRDFFSHYAGSETKIKWPNDLYWRDRKAGGILIENAVRGNIWQWAVIGIGINLNQEQFPASLVNPVSLKQITGKAQDPVKKAKELCNCLDNRFRQLLAGKEEKMLEEYNQQLYKQGQQVKLKKDNRIFGCTIQGVSASGSLQVSGTLEENFEHGEVTWL